jgi:hypothetical protein
MTSRGSIPQDRRRAQSRHLGRPSAAKRLAELEEKTEALAISHDTFSRNTRNQLKQVFDALRDLTTPPDPPKRPIGFVAPRDWSKKMQAKGYISKT